MDRRDFLTGVLGAATATPFAAIARAEGNQDTVVMRLFREHQSILDQAGDDGRADDEKEALFLEADEVRAKLMSEPCTGPADFAAKLIADTWKGELYTTWEVGEIWAEARVLTGTPL
jgi:hypothetical protein